MVSDAQGQRRNQTELMPSVIDFLHSQSDVEFLEKPCGAASITWPGTIVPTGFT